MPTLYPHQVESYNKLVRNKYILNASDVGVGKSYPSIKLIAESKGRCVVVCPSYLTHNWKREISKFDESASIYPDTSKRIVLISADLIWKAENIFHNLDVLVVDEAHYFTNLEARRTKALHQYVRQRKPNRLVLMTGTPFRNHIPELYSLLLLIDYGRNNGFQIKYPSLYTFCLCYCYKVELKIGKRTVNQFKGCKNLDSLKSWLTPVMFRYKLEDIKEIPEVIYEDIEVDPPTDAEMEFLMGDSLDSQMESGWKTMELGDRPPPHISSAKTQSAMMKAPSTLLVAEQEYKREVGPVVIFSDHRAPVRMIADGLAGKYKVAVITGDTSMAERDAINERFQKGEYDFLVGTIAAMGTGITLTKSHTCIFNDKNWTPSLNVQAVGRIRRMTQQSRCRAIVVSRKGVDAKINKTLRTKEEIAMGLLASDP